MSTLPYTQTKVVDQTRGISAATPVASLNIGSVINSETGPVGIMSNRNQADMINKYCTGSVISATDNDTIQFNGALLTAARIDTVRADTSAMRIGIGATGTKMYFNKECGLIDSVTSFRLTKVNPELKYLYIVLEQGGDDKIYVMGSVPDTKLRYFEQGNIIRISGSVSIKTFFDGLVEKGAALSSEGDKAMFAYKIKEVCDTLYVKDTEELQGVINKLTADKSKTVGSEDTIQVGGYTFYNSTTKGVNADSIENAVALNKSGDANITADKFMKEMVEYIVNNNTIKDPLAYAGDKVYYSSMTGPSIVVNCSAFSYECPDDDTYYILNHAEDSDNDSYFVADSCQFTIDDCQYYAHAKAESSEVSKYVCLSEDSISIPSFLDKLYEGLMSTYTVGKAAYNTIIIEGIHNISCSSNLKISNKQKIDQKKYEDKFAIVCQFTSSQPLFTFKYVDNKDDYHTISLSYSFKTLTGDMTFSFDGNALDAKGNSVYYEKYNEDPDYANPYIKIVELDGDDMFDTYDSGLFGNEVLNNPVTDAAFAEAILKFMDKKDKQYQFICDGGHPSVALANACKQVANAKFCQYVPSFPVDAKKVSEIKDYATQINIDNYEVQALVPAHKSTYNGNFLSTMPASLSYIMARVNAFNTFTGEFEPLFGSVKGAVSAPNLVKFYTDEEAQQLADMNINVITKDFNGTYIRSNFTGQKVNSYLSEDQNVYMANLVAQVCELYNPTIIAEINDQKLRSKVVSDVSNRITDRMVAGKSPSLVAFKVVCDDELNTNDIIEQRKLVYQVWVQYSPSIAYVLAYEYVKRLGSF